MLVSFKSTSDDLTDSKEAQAKLNRLKHQDSRKTLDVHDNLRTLTEAASPARFASLVRILSRCSWSM
jgi:hypothetical protein